MARILALDYGRKRIGIALSDPLGILANPLETYDGRQPLKHIAAVAKEHEVVRLLVGLPLRMNGTKGPQALEVEAFVEQLQAHVDIPIQMVDERLTSVEATRQLHEAGGKVGKDKGAVDRRAAAIILQHYLDSQALRAPDGH